MLQKSKTKVACTKMHAIKSILYLLGEFAILTTKLDLIWIQPIQKLTSEMLRGLEYTCV